MRFKLLIAMNIAVLGHDLDRVKWSSRCLVRYMFHALTLSLLMSYIYGATSRARTVNVVYTVEYQYNEILGTSEINML